MASLRKIRYSDPSDFWAKTDTVPRPFSRWCCARYGGKFNAIFKGSEVIFKEEYVVADCS